MGDRTFHWISSVEERNKKVLAELNEKLTVYYAAEKTRIEYNKMLDTAPGAQAPDIASGSFVQWFNNAECTRVLEVGCGNGRLRNHLDLSKREFSYTGIELSKETIDDNRKKWPANRWECCGIYDTPFEPGSFDLCFSFYVLEHLVYPVEALKAMHSLVKPGGFILLVFPDFISNGMMPSQHLGFGFKRSAWDKLNSFQIIDAFVSLYDSKIRLPKALKNVGTSPGKFIVNINPVCLHLPSSASWAPDMDAVYIASKTEVASWATTNNLSVSYPFGKSGFFSHHAFMLLQKAVLEVS